MAPYPASERDAARLLVMSRDDGARRHATFRDLGRWLRPRSLLIVNDTRVIKARLRVRKASGGAIEILLVRRIEDEPAMTTAALAAPGAWHERWQALVKGLKGVRAGEPLDCGRGVSATLIERDAAGRATLRFSGMAGGSLVDALESVGEVPLPPYIVAARRDASGDARAAGPPIDDAQRYQTVFARSPGAVAAPTAGLHFTPVVLDGLRQAGHAIASVTLHVGPGTFRPVEGDDPASHVMDEEDFEVSDEAAMAIEAARREGRPIVAVGTTVVRVLETLARGGGVRAGRGATSLYILPGARFEIVTDLITNFHLPRSTLLMLVAAFAGKDAVLAAYREAIDRGYRFYSYGDAMFIRPGALP